MSEPTHSEAEGAPPERPAQEERISYQELIKGQPGTGAADFFRILALVEVIASALLVLLLFEDSFALAVGLAVAGVTSAVLCYSLAIIIENIIAIRMELEFQSEVMEEEDDPTAV